MVNNSQLQKFTNVNYSLQKRISIYQQSLLLTFFHKQINLF